jgi:anhydro-N-acetylmuramic acid kinase
MTTRWIIGLASGASADGVDAALLEVDGVGLDLTVRVVQTLHQAYGRELRDLVLRAGGAGPCEIKQVSLLHRLLGETLAAAARQVADRASFSLQNVQCLGAPGQAIWHDTEGRFPSSLGLGMTAVVAERTGVTTVSDFASRDVAVGGQGMPLTALADYLLFRHPTESRLLLHLGCSARIVFLPAGGEAGDVRGFDVGPCNNLLDALMRQVTGGREAFDAGGKHAVQGRCLDSLLQRWLGHPFFQRRPPKSLPRQAFGDEFAGQAVQQGRQQGGGLHDVLCTATHFIAHGITQGLRRFLPAGRPPHRVLLCGGGVRNGLLWRLLEQQMEGIPLERLDRIGVPADARKAVGFGLLAALTVDGVPANIPAATGATGARLLGSLTPGSSTNWARCLAWMATQTAALAVVED